MNNIALSMLGLTAPPVRPSARPISLFGQIAAFTATPSKRERKAPVHPYAYRMESVAQYLADGRTHSTGEIAGALGISLDCALKSVHRLCVMGRARKAGLIRCGKTRMATWEAAQ